MVFVKSYIDEPLKLPLPKVSRWRATGTSSLSRDLTRSSSLSPTGFRECHGCRGPLIEGIHLYSSGKSWHKSCFQCTACGQLLRSDKYFERNGLPYCEKDYNNIFYYKCYVCCTSIYSTPVNIRGKHYHPLCFTCKKCSRPLNSSNYRERNGSFYCEDDYHKTFSPKCSSCKLPITDSQNATKTIGGIFHKEHFMCQECRIPLVGNEFRQVAGKVYCEWDYHRLFSPKCDFCSEPVRQGAVRSFGKVWHGECRMRCTTCMKFLTKHDYIRGADDKAYCRADWRKKFSTSSCPACRRVVFPGGKSVIAMGKEYHASCFYCATCFTDLNAGSYWEVEGKPYCYKHYYDKTYQKWRQIPIVREGSVVRTLERIRDKSAAVRRSMSSIDSLK